MKKSKAVKFNKIIPVDELPTSFFLTIGKMKNGKPYGQNKTLAIPSLMVGAAVLATLTEGKFAPVNLPEGKLFISISAVGLLPGNKNKNVGVSRLAAQPFITKGNETKLHTEIVNLLVKWEDLTDDELTSMVQGVVQRATTKDKESVE